MNDCPLHVGHLQRLIPDLTAELDASPLTPYDEKTATGQIRYVAARAAHLTGEMMVTFVVTEPLKNELRRVVESLRRRGHKINAAAMNLNVEAGNAIFGSETSHVAGSDKLRERVVDLDFEVSPTAFFQVNPWQAINLYRRVEQVAGPAGPSEVAWDLYCGAGQISLVLARLGYKTFGIEENPAAIADANANAKKNGLEKQATFVAARVEDAEPLLPAWAQTPSLIVANPSRRGLADSARQHLIWLGNQAKGRGMRLIYVSCAADTLGRDLKELADGGFTVRQVEAFDMFPQTDHMEWVAVLTR
jgi:23S rRNA (uracil1939-C5)-methyltransferase